MNQCPSEIPLLHTSPRLFKASRQKSSETREEKKRSKQASETRAREAAGEELHPEKKH